ncbi:Rieske (2Fe-2S) protein [Govanella unica]|uniref:Rieske (2Fe-2S) protein n=1 Tax=Govanella unica TaxID=2975056 RepID=A0A9X3TUV3_9PROT|nr:Rieske (2Fe-2S) protein [Govania unica]MDA5192561.1 Rieske (2Fe-2S) protein [Govania unica]
MNSISPTLTGGHLQRGTPIPPQSAANGYDQNWYPVCFSTDVQKDKILGSEFMNGRVIVIRGADGTAQVLSPYCRHLGADLSDGEIVNGAIRCPYHHWRYNDAGQCIATAVKDSPPADARLFRFPTRETLGFIWAFNGEEPLYDVPQFQLPEQDLIMRREFSVLTEKDHFVPYSNSSDIQHLMAVHHIDLDVNPEEVTISPHGMQYVQTMTIPGMGQLKQEVRVFGTNCLIFMSEFMGRPVYQMSAGKALPGNRTLSSLIVATPKSSGAPGEDEMIDIALTEGLKFGNRLFSEDTLIMKNLSFRQDMLTHSDRMLARFLGYVRDYPRTSIACDMIS